MGMTDATCAVSYLPILAGDKCRFFFLRRPLRDRPAPWEHLDAQWICTSLPVAGVYDGYGNLDGIQESPLTKFQVKTIAQRSCPIPAEELEGFKGADRYPNTLASVIFACQRGLLKLDLPHHFPDTLQTVSTAPMYVREEVYQAMIAGAGPGIGIHRERLEKVWKQQNPISYLRDILQQSQLIPDIDLIYLPFLDGLPDLFVDGNVAHRLKKFQELVCFTEDDWQLLSETVFDLRVFERTMVTELRREFHPALYHDQVSIEDGALDAHRMLAGYTERWCDAIDSKLRK